MNSENMKKMKKEYIEPAMRLVELKHMHHLLQSSGPFIFENSLVSRLYVLPAQIPTL